MNQKRISVVFGDVGGYGAAEPVLAKALEEGHQVSALLTAGCRDRFTEKKLQIDERIKVSCALQDTAAAETSAFVSGKFDLIIVPSSQSDEGTEVATAALTTNPTVPSIGIEDYYGSFGPTLKNLRARSLSHELDTLCVTDVIARDNALRSFNFPDRIVITGGPQYDKTLAVKKQWSALRKQLRDANGIKDGHIVFLVVGGVNGTAEMMKLLEEAINQSGFDQIAKVILRTHPTRASNEDNKLTIDYLMKSNRNWYIVPSAATSDELLPMADFVLSGFSTTNHYGVLYQMPGVVYIGTPTFQEDLLAEKGVEKPIDVTLGAALYARTSDDLKYAIRAVQHYHDTGKSPTAYLSLALSTQKQMAAQNDGHATDRVWVECQALMD